jgi:hypothetical protein
MAYRLKAPPSLQAKFDVSRGPNRSFIAVCLLLHATTTHYAAAAADAPLATTNRHPLTQAIGLPESLGAAVLQSGNSTLRATVEVANSSIYEADPRLEAPALILDGETRRLTLSLRHGLSAGWEAGATLPILGHDGGVLDPLIEGWHELFQLPNGGREDLPRGKLLYSYRNGEEDVRLADSAGGIGDLRMHTARRLGESLALRASLKLPTGEVAALTGSGGVDLATSLHFSSPRSENGLYTHISVGALLGQKGELLPQAREQVIGFGSATLGWQTSERWHLKVQLDAHSAAWDSPIESLGEPSLQLVVGATADLSPHWALDVAFSEDLTVERSPDIVFQFGLRWGQW